MVATTTAGPGRRFIVRRRAVQTPAYMSNAYATSVGHLGLGSVGLFLVAIAAWGGIVPFLGPTFGFSADGAASWHWSLTHAVVSLAPGAIAAFAGFVVLAGSRGMTLGRRRMSLAVAGLIVLICGAWFAVAPWAWPVIDNTHQFFVAATPLRMLANIAGYALGPGVLVGASGAYFMGWATRHQGVAGPTVVNQPATAAAPADKAEHAV